MIRCLAELRKTTINLQSSAKSRSTVVARTTGVSALGSPLEVAQILV